MNIKLEKKNNNAIAAISQLISDYEYWINKDKQVHFMVLKINYSFNKDLENRKIVINELKSFYLEEINFANGHLQDHRNWSSNYNANSGRLIISPSFYNKNKNKDSEISYIKTFKELKQLN
ncbi:UpaP162 family type II restriction enzyme [Mycoplasmopsis felis]|uniref:UpaP162 family type II restriction enzyme n=1 Tax=Mycoplasmopsis felis TaxID=33923 RepID=UPI003AF38B93